MSFQNLIELIYENYIPSLEKSKTEGVDFSIRDSYDDRNLLIAYSTYGYSTHYSQREMVQFLLSCGLS